MKALGIVSSPRKAGNSELAVKEILSQLPGSWEKEMIRLNELNIKYCTACYACIPADKKCKLNDDLDFFIEHVKKADKIVIGAPSYFLGGHTATKAVLDRMLSVLSNFREFAGKDCVIIAPYGRDKWEGAVKENMLIFAAALNLRVVDSATILAAVPSESVQGENLEVVSRLARSLMNPPEKQFSQAGELDCPFCSGAALTLFNDGNCICKICGGGGKLEYNNGEFSIKPNAENHFHFTPDGKISHANYLEEKKQFFLNNRHNIKEIQSKYTDMDWWVQPGGKT